MKLADLVPDMDESAAGHLVTGFAIDSRKVAPGTIFGAFHGAAVNGEGYIPAAIAAGAIAVVARPEAVVTGAVHIADARPRRRFAELAARFFQPAPAHIAAVTGTNGKTSVAEMTRQLWAMLGHGAASIGTLGVTLNGESVSTGLTTPDIVTFLSNMNGLAREGVSHAIYEASSHGLDQYRGHGLDVEIGAFTNLSRDHLDYHGDMDQYFAAKMRLFDESVRPGGTAVIWADDSWSQRAVGHARARGLTCLTVGRQGRFIHLAGQEPTQLGQRLTLEVEGAAHTLNLPLIGAYQAANALVAGGIAMASGDPVAKVLDAMARLQPVRGRLERAAITRTGAVIYVDYAHTPDGVSAACMALRPHVRGRLITLLGAGGDRDRGKRAEMGRVASALSDVLIVTDDNPRSEDPAAIRADVMAGAHDAMEIADRRAAIAAAVDMAKEGDIVLLAGKGHEQGQIIGDRVIPFDDVAVARECAA